MPGTKQRTVRRKKKYPPHLRKRAKTVVVTVVEQQESSCSSRGSSPAGQTPAGPVSAPQASLPQPAPVPANQPPATQPVSVASTSHERVPASKKKLRKSPRSTFYDADSEEDTEYDVRAGGKLSVVENTGLERAIKRAFVCKKCFCGLLAFKENPVARNGLCMNPYFICERCKNVTKIPFSTVKPNDLALSLNRKSVLANKCIGGTYASLSTFFAMLDQPHPVS